MDPSLEAPCRCEVDAGADYFALRSEFDVAAGQAVAAGQVVGRVGSTGRSTGPHLHYEVRVHGLPLNPFSSLAVESGALYVDGRRVVAPAASTRLYALPAAPGGTHIVLADDEAGDDESVVSRSGAMHIDFE
jgi:hypothetical protein